MGTIPIEVSIAIDTTIATTTDHITPIEVITDLVAVIEDDKLSDSFYISIVEFHYF